MPTARAIPSSPRRSAASITKIRKISRIPDAIENEPKVVKNAMNMPPTASAVVSAFCLVLSISSPSGATAGFSAATTASVFPTPPLFATNTAATRPGLSSSFWAAVSGISTAAPSVPAPE